MVPGTLNPINLHAPDIQIAETNKGRSCTLGEFGSADRRDFVSRRGRLGGDPRVPYGTRLDSSSKFPW